MTFTEKLIVLRKKQGLSQLDLAEKLNVSRQAISRWESGQAIPSIDNLKYLSRLYGVSIDDLLSDREEDTGKSAPPVQAAPDVPRKNQPNRIKIALLSATILLVLILTVTAFHQKKNTTEEATPYEEMTLEEGTVSITGNFSITW